MLQFSLLIVLYSCVGTFTSGSQTILIKPKGKFYLLFLQMENSKHTVINCQGREPICVFEHAQQPFLALQLWYVVACVHVTKLLHPPDQGAALQTVSCELA